jgi:hypothetical protein
MTGVSGATTRQLRGKRTVTASPAKALGNGAYRCKTTDR